jgi:WD40 repeat protein
VDSAVHAHHGLVWSVAWSGDGRLASGAGDQTVRVWATSGWPVHMLEGRQKPS